MKQFLTTLSYGKHAVCLFDWELIVYNSVCNVVMYDQNVRYRVQIRICIIELLRLPANRNTLVNSLYFCVLFIIVFIMHRDKLDKLVVFISQIITLFIRQIKFKLYDTSR